MPDGIRQPSYLERLDALGRRHGGWMALLLAILTIAATLILLYGSKAPVVLYQNF